MRSMKLLLSSAAGILASVVALPVAFADIPAPGPKGPNIAEWVDTPDFQRATLLIVVVAIVVAAASIYGLWALRKHHPKAPSHNGAHHQH